MFMERWYSKKKMPRDMRNSKKKKDNVTLSTRDSYQKKLH